MASERLDTTEKIMRMVEWSNVEPWEYYDTEQAVRDPLARAKRYVSAQAFLLSWQEGKVPTGWRRPRRLADFEGKYPAQMLESVHDKMTTIYNQRNQEKTEQLNMLIKNNANNTDPDDRKYKAITGTESKGDRSDNNAPHEQQRKDDDDELLLQQQQQKEKEMQKERFRKNLQAIKKDMADLSRHIFDAKSALKIATNNAADSALRIKALCEALPNKH